MTQRRSRRPTRQPPSAPGNARRDRRPRSARRSAGAPSTDNVGVVRYNVHRSTTPGFTPSAANRIAQPTGTSYTDTGSPPAPTTTGSPPRTRPATSSAASNEASARRRRHDAAVCPGHAERERGGRQGDAVVGRGDRQRRRVALQRPPLDHPGFTPSAANRIAQPTGTSYIDTTGARHLLLQGHRRGRGRQHRPGLERGERGRLADTTPPSAPASLTASVAGGTVNLSWSASTDDVGVVRYNVYRGTSAGFTPTRRQPDRAADAGPATPTAAWRSAPTTTRSRPRTRPATSARPRTRLPRPSPTPRRRVHRAASPRARRRDRQPHLERGHRQRRRHAATTSTARHLGLHPQRRQPDRADRRARATATSALAAAPTTTSSTAEDAAGNISAPSNTANATVPDTTPAERARQPDAPPAAPARQPHLERLDRQRRRHPLQRPPLDHLRLHAHRRQPDRAADGHQLHRHRPRRRHLLLQGHRRGRGRQPQPRLKPGERDRQPPPRHRPRRRLRLRHGQRHHHRRPVRHRQQRHASPTPPGRPSGKYGNALVLQRHQRLRSPSPTPTRLDLTTGMTLEAWVRADHARQRLPDGRS